MGILLFIFFFFAIYKHAEHLDNVTESGAPGLVDRVFAVHAGSPAFDSHWQHNARTISPIQ